MEKQQVKVIFEKVINGTITLVNVTTPAGDQGAYVLQLVKTGNRFWAWPTIPAGKIIACDFNDAPVCGATASDNNTLIAGIVTRPEDVLIFSE